MADVQTLAKRLNLSYIRDNADELIRQARQTAQGYDDFLSNLLTMELERRCENGNARRIREARFPVKYFLADFDRSKYDRAFAAKFDELETLSFIDAKENIILIGTSGAGKTHYATALGISACMQGKSVLFAVVPNLVVELKEAMNQRQLSAYRRRFERFDLVILDEMGYISFDKSSCDLLFNMISNRHGKGSFIVTTNLSFEGWEGVFADPVLTNAMIDRLAHKGHVLDISRERGGRFEETIAWLSNGGGPRGRQV
jgi:DNA replication protein DnaC